MNPDNYWSIIKQCIDDAKNKSIDQPQMATFLKSTFDIALDALTKLVQKGIDLSDKTTIYNLTELELAIAQIPQNRVRAFDVASVIDGFEDYYNRFFTYLSLPKQNAENSLSCSWIIGRFESFVQELEYLSNSLDSAENARNDTAFNCNSVKAIIQSSKKSLRSKEAASKPQSEHIKLIQPQLKTLKKELNEQLMFIDNNVARLKREREQLKDRFSRVLDKYYLFTCYNLLDSGSDMVIAMLTNTAEQLAHELMAEDMWQQASEVWHFVIKSLSQDNLRIVQREERLKCAIDSSMLVDVTDKFEKSNVSEVMKYLPGLFNPETPWVEENGFDDAISSAKSILICEISPNGSAMDVSKRMVLAVDTLGEGSKDVFYYVIAGNLISAGLCNPDFSEITGTMRERYHVVKWVCQYNPKIPGRYLRVVLGIIKTGAASL